jgi:hypothetical protein
MNTLNSRARTKGGLKMEFMTLHDFMFWTKGMAYVGMGVGLVAFVAFWLFLTERDEDKFADKEEE